MVRTRERIQNFILLITDAICVLLSFYVSGYIWLQMYKGFAESNMKEQLSNNVFTLCIAYIITTILYSEQADFTVRGSLREIVAVTKKMSAFAACIAIYELLRRKTEYFPRGVYILCLLLASVLMWLVRLLIKKILIRSGKGHNAINMILVTTEERAKRFLSKLNNREDWMRKLSSIIVIDKNMTGQSICNIPIVSDQDGMINYIKTEIADEVYLDVGSGNRERLKMIVEEIEDMGVTVHLRLDILEMFEGYDMTMGRVNGELVATFAHRIYPYKKLVIKRLVDIAGGLIGTMIMLFAFVFVAPAIKIESKGPIFFKQKRVGKGGRFFYIYKFRSMYIDAEERKKELMSQNEMDGLMFKMKDDPRITKVGKFIRKTSIDELPQFINVLKGDMSLVGTRPPTVNEFNMYEGHHKRRLTMKPGITGMWQAYGRNSVHDFEDVVKMDCEYIDNWGFGLDIKILFKTIITVFTDGGK